MDTVKHPNLIVETVHLQRVARRRHKPTNVKRTKMCNWRMPYQSAMTQISGFSRRGRIAPGMKQRDRLRGFVELAAALPTYRRGHNITQTRGVNRLVASGGENQSVAKNDILSLPTVGTGKHTKRPATETT
jgi:hypothetical protein